MRLVVLLLTAPAVLPTLLVFIALPVCQAIIEILRYVSFIVLLLAYTGCSPCSTIPNCLNCYTFSPYCTTCISGFYHNYTSCINKFYIIARSECVPCSNVPNCQTCLDGPTCKICNIDWYLDFGNCMFFIYSVNRTCVSCSFIPNCDTCVDGPICTKCLSGFFLDFFSRIHSFKIKRTVLV